MNRITTKYKKYQHDIPVTSKRVIEKMEENKEAFPNPPEALEKLKILLPEYEQALVNAMGRDKHMVAVKDDLTDKRYWFRVIAIGYYGQNGYSPVETRVIQ